MTNEKQIPVYQTIRNTGLIPLFFHSDQDTALQIAKACHEANAPVLEFTNRGAHAITVFEELSKKTVQLDWALTLGAGSIIDEPTTSRYINAGAKFIVSPTFNPDVAQCCNRHNIPYMPGCATPTEIERAYEHGAEIVKLFPASVIGGPAFLRAVRGPMPWVQAMPTGGVTTDPEHIQAWFDAGAVCLGMGSALIRSSFIIKEDFEALCEHVKTTLGQVTEAMDTVNSD